MSQTTIGLAASPWIVATIILAAFAFAVFTYRSTLPAVGPVRRWSLIFLRTLGIALLLLALFEPILSTLTVDAEEPSIVVAVDNSQSMTLPGLDSVRIREAARIVRQIEGSALGERSGWSIFSDSAIGLAPPLPYGRFDAKGPETRLDAPFSLVADSLRRNNVRAIVLLSDGRYNAGANPITEAENLGIPVYTIGFGDSVEPKDLSLQQIFTNEIAYVGSELPVEVRVKSAGYDGGAAQITLRDDNGIIASQPITLSRGTNEYTASFVYKPKSEGIARLQASVAGEGGELTTKNNGRSAFVRVRSNKRSYVLIAGGPDPDVAFVRRHLGGDPNIQVRTFIQRSGTEFLEGKLDAASFRDAEAVILIGYPTPETSPENLRIVQTAVQNGNLPLMVVMGARVDVNKLKLLESLLPVTFGTPRGREMQVLPDLTEAGRTNPATRVTNPNGWSELPPIFRNETQATAKPESEVLARAKLGTTQLEEPLIVSRRLGRSRSLIVVGHGIYRWELIGEGLRAARGESGNGVLEDFVSNSLRWLATRDQERRVRITSDKQLYNMGETVRILAQVYDETYDPISDATVTVDVRGPEKSYPMTLAPVGNGRYEATLGSVPSGDYSFSGKAVAGGKELGSDAGRFVVGEIGLEFLQPSMNAELMRALAARTGGRFYTSRTSGSIIEDILANKGFAPRSVESQRDLPLWSYPWVLAAALGAFVLEWVIRKRSGMM